MKANAIYQHNISTSNPLIANSMRIESNPLNSIGASGFTIHAKKSNIRTTRTCIEGYDFTIDLLRELKVVCRLVDVFGPWEPRTINLTGASAISIASILGVDTDQIGFVEPIKNSRDDQSYANDTYQNILFNYRYRTKRKEFEEQGQYWQVSDPGVEEAIGNSECYEVGRVDFDNNDRIFFDKYIVRRPHWQQRITYNCTSKPRDGCSYFRDRGCQLENSRCYKAIGGICLLWQHNYSCPAEKQEIYSSLQQGSIFCLGGDCFTPTINPNTDIDSTAHLAALHQMRTDMKTDPISVFEGEIGKCSKDCVDFLDCCRSMTGWGDGLSQCNPAEKELAFLREKDRCIRVGTYCSSRIPLLGICLVKKTAYCCFQSRLARLFQAQARQQLGIGFGSPEYPNCRGLYVEELSKLDFSKIDLHELFSELLNKGHDNMNKDFSDKIPNGIPNMQKDIDVYQRNENNDTAY